MNLFKPLLFLSVCLCCSCDMGRFYAGKRLGGNNETSSLKETKRVETLPFDSLPANLSKKGVILHANIARDETKRVPQIVTAFVPGKSNEERRPTPNRYQILTKKIKSNHRRRMADTNTGTQKEKGDSFSTIFFYALVIALEVGVLVFLIAWIFKPVSAAFITALCVMAGVLIVTLLMGLFLGLSDRDRPADSPHH